ncbi:hypothetical protein CR513_13307, partial [Mucuna pruriens]
MGNFLTKAIEEAEPNPKEKVEVITLRSEKVLKESQQIEKKVAQPKNETPINKIAVDVTNQGKDMGTSYQVTKTTQNIPFIEVITQMPNYAKFLGKKIISNKKKLEEFEVINLAEKCYAIILQKLSPKLKDPKCFTIPHTMRNSYFEKPLYDLGTSINLMSYSVFKKLDL